VSGNHGERGMPSSKTASLPTGSAIIAEPRKGLALKEQGWSAQRCPDRWMHLGDFTGARRAIELP